MLASRVLPGEVKNVIREPLNLQAAREYVKRGWKVFPLKPRSKIPLTPRGFHNATIDTKQLEDWWLREPQAGVGIATGSPSQLIVVDIDPRNGGTESLMLLEAKHGALPETVECVTGGGGRHLYYALPPDVVYTSAKPWAGIDLKSDGGYVCAPFTTHESGLRYHWKDGHDPDASEIAPAPVWILETLVSRKAKDAADAQERSGTDRVIPEGQRSDSLTSLAGTMQRRGMTYESILRALLAENQARCHPPLDDAEVVTIVTSVSRYQPDSDAAPGVSKDAVEGRVLQFLDLGSLAEPPPIKWLFQNRIAFGDVSLIVGPPGSGKSWVSYEIAVAGAMGLPILGAYELERPLRVLIVDEENPVDEVLRRLWLIATAWEAPPKELARNLMVMKPCQGWTFRDKNACYALLKQVEQFRPDVIVFDSFVAVSTVHDESRATEVRQFFHDYAYPIRSVCGSTMLFIHHTNKAVYQHERMVQAAGLVRGSIDFIAAPDSSLLVEKRESGGRHFHLIDSLKVRRGEQPPVGHFQLVQGVNGGLRPRLITRVEVEAPHTEPLAERARRRILDLLVKQAAECPGQPLPARELAMWTRTELPELVEENLRQIFSRMTRERLICSVKLAHDGRLTGFFLGAQPPAAYPQELGESDKL